MRHRSFCKGGSEIGHNIFRAVAHKVYHRYHSIHVANKIAEIDKCRDEGQWVSGADAVAHAIMLRFQKFR